MKKKSRILILSTALVLCAMAAGLAAAGIQQSRHTAVPHETSGTPVAALPAADPENTTEAPGESSIPDPCPEETFALTCRIISGADTGNLLLAAQNDTAELYMLNINNHSLTAQSPAFEKLENGMLLKITYDGMILESWPAQFGYVTEILVLEAGMDNLCELYLNVLNDLWETDPALNSDITQLGVDLSATRLSPSEQAGVALTFGNMHGLDAIQGTFDDLAEMGYIDQKLKQWENGCLFSITEQTPEGIYNANVVNFHAQKWRSGDGAYFFTNCTSTQSALGIWGGYAIGGHAIS